MTEPNRRAVLAMMRGKSFDQHAAPLWFGSVWYGLACQKQNDSAECDLRMLLLQSASKFIVLANVVEKTAAAYPPFLGY